jgi:hypothetical protein
VAAFLGSRRPEPLPNNGALLDSTEPRYLFFYCSIVATTLIPSIRFERCIIHCQTCGRSSTAATYVIKGLCGCLPYGRVTNRLHILTVYVASDCVESSTDLLSVMAYRIKYFRAGVLVGEDPCPKFLADAIMSTGTGLVMHKADKALILDMEAGGKVVQTVSALA